MGVRKADEQQIRTLTQNSTGTYAVTLPISLIRKLRWQKGQRLVVKLRGNKLQIQDWE